MSNNFNSNTTFVWPLFGGFWPKLVGVRPSKYLGQGLFFILQFAEYSATWQQCLGTKAGERAWNLMEC